VPRGGRKQIYGILKDKKLCKPCGFERPLSHFYLREPDRKNGKATSQYSQFCKEHMIADRCRRSKENQNNGLCACGRPKVENFSQCQSCIDVRKARFADPDKTRKIYDRRSEQRAEWRRVVLKHYGAMCKCCEETREEFLALDHVGGWGKDHKDLKGRKIGSYRLYAYIIRENFPDTFRVLCHNCNSSHGYYGYCPHDRERESQQFHDLADFIQLTSTSSPPLPC